MPVDYRGQPVYTVTSNRPPLYVDGAQTQGNTAGIVQPYPVGTATAGNTYVTVGSSSATLLKANGVKQIQVVDPTGAHNWIAQSVQIINASGQTATLQLVVAKNLVTKPGMASTVTTNQQAQVSTFGGQEGPTGTETTLMPITILSGDNITINARVFQIIESTTVAQTGNGVRYIINLEPLAL